MRRIAMTLVLGAGLVGCGGDEEGDGTCTPRSGLYKASYTEKSGTCGPINDAVINADTPGTDGCVGMPLPLDACEGTVDVVCPIEGQTEKLASVGKVKWSKDGSSASGQLQLTLKSASGATICSSIYTLTIRRF